MAIVKKTVYVDDETGEILEQKQSEIKDITVKFKMGAGDGKVASRFSKVFHLEDPNFEIASHYQYFYKCLLQLEMATNRMVNFTKPPLMNEPLNELDLAELLNCNIKTVNRFLEVCIERGIIARVDINKELWGFVVNPIYALNGNKINSTLYTMFNKNNILDKHIPYQDLVRLKEFLKMRNIMESCVQEDSYEVNEMVEISE